MTSRGCKLFALTLIPIFLSCCYYVGILAQTYVPISLDSMKACIQVGPEEKYEGKFTVTNAGDRSTQLDIMLTDYTITEQGAFQTLDPGALGERSLAGYISYAPDQITLEPGESAEVHYSFTLPADADGPHWAGLIVTAKAPIEEGTPSESDEGMGLVAHLRIRYVYTIIQRSLTPPPPEGRMVMIDANGSTTEDGGQILTVESTFENLGDAILTYQGYIEARNEQGEAILRYDFPVGHAVYPRARRIFSHTFRDVDMPAGQYLILCVIDFGGENLVGAQYMATVGESP